MNISTKTVGPPMTHRRLLWLACLLISAMSGRADAAGVIDGYLDDQALAQHIQTLGQREHLSATRLVFTPGNRPVWLMTVAEDQHETKPAILIVGAADAPRLVGTEIAVRLADKLSDPENETSVSLRSRYTFYIVPRPNPDASAAFFSAPYSQRTGNDRPTDDDRDHTINEDGHEDLNGDGHITLMRVEDPTGRYISHPGNSAILIEADPLKDETGRYKIYTEGRDNDGDEQFNEDGHGGVNLNANLTFDYPYFEPGAGPHQVSEPESRALVDFAFDHPEIVAVYTIGADDNLYNEWSAQPSQRQGRIKTQLIQDDQPYTKHLAELFREAEISPDQPSSPGDGKGSFSKWAYFHYGRWSLSTPGWWVPKVPEPEQDNAAETESSVDGEDDDEIDPLTLDEIVGGPLADESTDLTESAEPIETSDPLELAIELDLQAEIEAQPIADTSSPDETRGTEDLNALRYLATNQIDGFAPWVSVIHPDFPDKQVEVGSFKPFFLINPPADQLDSLADKHLDYIATLADQLPRIEITETQTESLGSNVTRLTITVTNHGFLPTMTHMGRINQIPYPLRFELSLPEGNDDTEFIRGHRRGSLSPISGTGGTVQHDWLIRTSATSIQLKVGSPSTGWDETEIEL